jgi:hypothetical protein
MVKLFLGNSRSVGEVTGWRTSCNKELHNMFLLSVIVTVSKTRTLIPVRHIVSIGTVKNLYRILIRKQ